MSKLTIKEVHNKCREKFCSINGAPIGRLVEENLCKERAVLAQASSDTKTKIPFANRNGKPDKSDGSDKQVAKIKKELTFAQSSRTNYIKQMRISQRNVQSAVPRARRKILRKMRSGARESVNKQS